MILVAGCSYTEPFHNVWPHYLFGDAHKNIAVSGASNQFIYYSVLKHIINLPKPDYVYVVTTGLHRISVPLSRSHDVKVGKNSIAQIPLPGLMTLETAGPMGFWNQELTDPYKSIVKELYWPLDKEYLSTQGIIPLISLFSLLESYKIHYNWTSVYDYAHPQTGMHDNHSYGSIDVRNKLYSVLPWEKFIGPTPYEYGIIHDGFRDGVHLDEKTQIAWANEIRKTINI